MCLLLSRYEFRVNTEVGKLAEQIAFVAMPLGREERGDE